MSVTRLNQQRVDFYVGLLDDLLDIVDRLENCGSKPEREPEGAVIAKVEMDGFRVEIGMEYFIYINTYGIPLDGVFDEVLLERIRNGLPVPPTSVCGGCHKMTCCCKPVVCDPTPNCPTDPSGCTADPSGCNGDCDSNSDCSSDSDDDCGGGGCGGGNSACRTCHYVVCCCASACTDCSGTPTLLDEPDTTGATGTTRVDNDTTGSGDLGIVIEV